MKAKKKPPSDLTRQMDEATVRRMRAEADHMEAIAENQRLQNEFLQAQNAEHRAARARRESAS